MIDYKEWNEKLSVSIMDRYPLLVIYKEGTKTIQELRSLHSMKGFVFYSDESELRMNICGFQLGGIIVEEGANLNYSNFRYAVTRLRSEAPYFIFAMDKEHVSRLHDITEEYIASTDNYDHIEEMKGRIMLYHDNQFHTIKSSEWWG